jgi:hypothetical protein
MQTLGMVRLALISIRGLGLAELQEVLSIPNGFERA